VGFGEFPAINLMIPSLLTHTVVIIFIYVAPFTLSVKNIHDHHDCPWGFSGKCPQGLQQKLRGRRLSTNLQLIMVHPHQACPKTATQLPRQNPRMWHQHKNGHA
jgi:hypothetical protein